MPKSFCCRGERITRLPLRVPPQLGLTIAKCSRFASTTVCEKLIRLAEEEGFQVGEGGDGDADLDYPQATVDLEIDKAPTIRKYLIKHRLVHVLSKAMMLTHGKRPIGFDDIFIVRYLAEEQRQLIRHFDGGDVSFMLALSPRNSYDGGGTKFDALGGPSRTLHLDQGDLVIFDAKIFHSGVEITRGSRYLLVGFTYTNQKSVKSGHLDLNLCIDFSNLNSDMNSKQTSLKRKVVSKSKDKEKNSCGRQEKKFRRVGSN